MTVLQEKIRTHLQSLPEFESWPEIITLFRRSGNVPRPDWEIPSLACDAAGGGDLDAVSFGAAAIACLQISIILVDDMLDDDPRGEHHSSGIGNVANIALAMQAAAFRLMAMAPVSHVQHANLSACLAKAALATAAGQQLDAQNLTGEANYWKQVDAKSTPFYGAVYEIGGIFANADTAVTQALFRFGKIIGEIIQIEDDLHDALQTPVNADWQQGRNNLLLLYAQTADYAEKDRFNQILHAVAEDSQLLDEAQQILISCGAVSYATYQMIERYQIAQKTLQEISLPNPQVLQITLDTYAQDALLPLLKSGGTEISLATLQETLSYRK